MYQSADQDFLWIPQATSATIMNVADAPAVVLEWDTDVWDYCRIDWCGLVMNYVFSDGNASFEACLVDDSLTFYPFMAVAETESTDYTPEFYVNKVYANIEAPWYLGGDQSIWLRGESGLLSASTGSLVVSSSCARVPAG
jgi:hypothetical protein